MPLNPKQVLYLLSGGANNALTFQSLGGAPSQTMISDNVDNLFNKVTQSEMGKGGTVYRCFYIYNTSPIALQNVKCWIEQPSPISATTLGVATQNQMHHLTIDENGAFAFKYTGGIGGKRITQITNPILHTSENITNTANQIQNSLNELALLDNVTSTIVNNNFIITFADNRRHIPLEIVNTGLKISHNKITFGSPINTIAVNIGQETIAPTGVTFTPTSSVAPIAIGTINSFDFFSLWLQRITKPNTVSRTIDKVIFRLKTHIHG